MGVTLFFASSKTPYSPPPPPLNKKYAGQSIRALPIRILTIGKKRSKGVELVVDEYVEKLRHYCPVDDVRLKSNPKNANARDVTAQVEHEDAAVMGVIKNNEWVVMLDEHGLGLDSDGMASLIADAGNTGASSMLFCIGGPYGHGRQYILKKFAKAQLRAGDVVTPFLVVQETLKEYRITCTLSRKGGKASVESGWHLLLTEGCISAGDACVLEEDQGCPEYWKVSVFSDK